MPIAMGEIERVVGGQGKRRLRRSFSLTKHSVFGALVRKGWAAGPTT